MSDDSGDERLSAILAVQDPDKLRHTIDAMPDDDDDKGSFFIVLAEKFQSRFEEGGRIVVADIDKAIHACELAVARASTDLDFVFARIVMGEVLEARAQCLRDASGLQKGIDVCRLAVERSQAVPAALTRALLTLASVCMTRYELGDSRDLADVKEAMVSHRRVINRTPRDDPELPQYLWSYGRSIMRHFRVVGDADILREACTCFRRAADLVPDTDERKPGLLGSLGGLLTDCFTKRHRNVDDIHEAIVVLVRAVELTPHSDPSRSAYLDRLTTALSCRFGMHGISDCAPFAQYHSAVDLVPQGHRHRATLLNLLAQSFRVKFVANLADHDYEQAIIDIDMAITLLLRALEETADGVLSDADTASNEFPTISRSASVDLLADTLTSRFQCPNNVDTFFRHVPTVGFIPEEHPEKSFFLTRLAEDFRKRFSSDGDPNDFVESRDAARHALELEPDSVGALRCLGCLLTERLARMPTCQTTADVDEAIPLLERAVDISNEFEEHVMIALARASSMRFERLGDSAVSDIERAIALLQRAIDQLPDGHADIPTFWAELANLFRARFARYRKTRDVEEAIRALKRALDLSPSSAPRRSKYVGELADLFQKRWEHFHTREDMDSAVEALREVARSSNSEPSVVMRLSFMLAGSHASDSDFDEAVDLMRNLIKRDARDAAMQKYLAMLGLALAQRYERRRLPADLDEAIDLSEQSLSLSGSSEGADLMTSVSLSTCYFHRFDTSHRAPDLDKGIDLVRDALEHLPPWLMTSNGLKLLIVKLILRLRTHPSPQVGHVQDARDQAQRAIKAGGGPSTAVEAALDFTSLVEWADLLPERETQRLLEDATLMYDRIILLIPRVAWLGDDINSRLARMSGYSARNVVGAAVAHALRMNDATRALEWFEQGRAIVWTQINSLRTPVDELRTQFPDLAGCLERMAQALENAGRGGLSLDEAIRQADAAQRAQRAAAQTAELSEVRSAKLEGDRLKALKRHEKEVAAHRCLAEDYEDLVDEIRGLPGFKNFLRPRSKDDLLLATVHGPVACINMHSSSCDALVICDSKLHHVHLPNLNPEVAEEWQQTMYNFLGLEFPRDRKSRPARTTSNDGLLGVFRRMWVVVVQPIFALLGWTDGGLVYERRIKWCTTGSLAFLPLHAAGPYNGISLNASDIAVSSYTSTIAALLPEPSGSGSTAPAQPSILMVAQPDVPKDSGLTPLPGTKQEFEHVQKYFSAASSTFLLGPEGTASAVLENMTKHPYIHLACHGIQGVTNAMESAFQLDRLLTLHELMAKSSRVGELAFLSACETSRGHENIPDEAVHLAAAMLSVGYRSVVGTMWSISDSAAPLVADEFYNFLLQLPAVNGRPDVAYALHVATQVLREKVGDEAVATWVPFVHFGL